MPTNFGAFYMVSANCIALTPAVKTGSYHSWENKSWHAFTIPDQRIWLKLMIAPRQSYSLWTHDSISGVYNKFDLRAFLVLRPAMLEGRIMEPGSSTRCCCILQRICQNIRSGNNRPLVILLYQNLRSKLIVDDLVAATSLLAY